MFVIARGATLESSASPAIITRLCSRFSRFVHYLIRVVQAVVSPVAIGAGFPGGSEPSAMRSNELAAELGSAFLNENVR